MGAWVPSASGTQYQVPMLPLTGGCSASPVFQRQAVRGSGVHGPRREVDGECGSVCGNSGTVAGFERVIG